MCRSWIPQQISQLASRRPCRGSPFFSRQSRPMLMPALYLYSPEIASYVRPCGWAPAMPTARRFSPGCNLVRIWRLEISASCATAAESALCCSSALLRDLFFRHCSFLVAPGTTYVAQQRRGFLVAELFFERRHGLPASILPLGRRGLVGQNGAAQHNGDQHRRIRCQDN